MNSPNWTLNVSHAAAKSLRRVPAPDRRRLLAALDELARDPKAGDVRPLQPAPNLPAFRKRVGSYRILFDLNPIRRVIDVTEITRRTSTTY